LEIQNVAPPGSPLARAQELDAILIGCVEEGRRLKRQAFAILDEMEDRQFYRELGFNSLGAYIWDRWGKSYRWFRDQVKIEKMREQIPMFSEALDSGRVQPALAKEIARIITPANAETLIMVTEGRSYRDGLVALQDVEARRTFEEGKAQSPDDPTRLEFRTIKVVVNEETFRVWVDVMTISERIVGASSTYSKIVENMLDAALSEFVHSFPQACEGVPAASREESDGGDPEGSVPA